jgi:transcription initiation factor IIE alpha subunit
MILQLPNKPYIAITKDIINIKGNNQFIDTLVYSYIKFRENFKTNISDVTEIEISNKLCLTLKNVYRAISRLKNINGLFKDIVSYYKDGKTYNRYIFNKTYQNYFFISYSFFNEKIDNNIKGLLLQLKAICLNDTNYLFFKNKTNLAKLLHKDIKTLKKYIDTDKIMVIDNKEMYLLDSYILPMAYKKDILIDTYFLLYYWCLTNKVIAPFFNNRYLSIIATKYNVFNDGVSNNSYNGMDYLPTFLNLKCGKDIQYLTYKYILKIMNKEITNNKQNNIWMM